MRCLPIVLALIACNCQGPPATLFYEVTPNTERFPFPTEVHNLKDRDPAWFDWQKYLDSATSEADRRFRANRSSHEYAYQVSAARSRTRTR